MTNRREEARGAGGVTPAPTSVAPDMSMERGHDSYGALRFRDFRLLLIGACLAQFGQQMLTVALGWELYNRTGSALVLGGVGLAQVIPVLALSLPAGAVADRYSRGRIVIVAQVVLALGALGVALLSFHQGPLLLNLWLPRGDWRGRGVQRSGECGARRPGHSHTGV